MGLLELQRRLQRDAYGIDPQALEGEACVEYVRMNVLAAIVELTELLQNVDGWKAWQTEREHAGEIGREDNQRAYIEESVDVLHFVLNLMLVVNITDEELDSFFQTKQRVNAARQELGYRGSGVEFDLEHPEVRA